MKISRRGFIKYSGGTVIGLAAGTYGVSQLNQVDYSEPAYQYWQHKEKGDMSDPEYIVMCGTLASSPHNTQPWKFKLDKDRIEIYADRSRNLGAADPDLRLLTQGMGCAIENMKIGAIQLGYNAAQVDIGADNQFNEDGYCATLYLNEKGSPSNHQWFDAIFMRQTNRSAYDTPFTVPESFRHTLNQESKFTGLQIVWFSERVDIAQIAAITQKAVRLFVKNDEMVRAANKWFRLKRQVWETKKDGIAIFASDAPFFIKHYFQWFLKREDMDSDMFKQGEVDLVDRTIPSTSLWVLILAEEKSFTNRIYGGQMLEKVYLEAARQNLAICPVAYPTDMEKTIEVLKKRIDAGPDAELLSLTRIGKADRLDKSVRLDLREVMI